MSKAAGNHALSALQEILRQRMNEQADHVATGGCADYPSYTHITGVIKGLAIAERELLDLDERMEQT